MAITLFGIVVVPTDGAAASNTTQTISVTPLSNMVEGMLVYVRMQRRAIGTVFSVNTSGGQYWKKEAFEDDGTCLCGGYWCRFNGTWGANPVFDFGGATSTSLQFIVFSPSSPGKYWAVDYEIIRTTFAAGTTPFTKTINSYTTTQANTVAIASWESRDDNTWGTLSGTGWSQTGLTAQYRNTAGSDMSAALAYRIQTSTGATNNVSLNQATLGGDAGFSQLCVFYETDWDYIGYPTIGNSVSAFTSGDAVGCKLSLCHKNGRGAIAQFYATSTSGANTMSLSLYKVVGADWVKITTVTKAFNAAGFYRIAMPSDLTLNGDFWIFMAPSGAADFKYAFYPGTYDNYACTHNIGTFGSLTWPSTIATATPSGGYFASNCSVSLQFSTEFGGALSDGIADVNSNSVGKTGYSAISDGNNDSSVTAKGKAMMGIKGDGFNDSYGEAVANSTGGTAALEAMGDGFNDSIATMKGIARYAAISDGINDGNTNSRGKTTYSAIGDGFNDGSSGAIGKTAYAGISDGISDVYTNEIGKARYSAISDSPNDAIITIQGRAQYGAISDGVNDAWMNMYGKATYQALSDGNNDTSSGARLVAYMGAISDGYNDSITGMKGYAKMASVGDNPNDCIFTIRGIGKYFAYGDGYNDAYVVLAQQGQWYAMGDGINDSYATLIGKAALSGISDDPNDASSGIYGKAKMQGIADNVNDSSSGARLTIYMSGISDGGSDAMAQPNLKLMLQGLSDGYSDVTMNLRGFGYMGGISDGVNDGVAGARATIYMNGLSDGFNSSYTDLTYGDPLVFATVIRRGIQSANVVRTTTIQAANILRTNFVMPSADITYRYIQSADITRDTTIPSADVVKDSGQ